MTLPVGDGIAAAMRESYDRLIDFSQDPAFQALVLELYRQPRPLRPRFVREEILSDERRRARGVVVPEGIWVQRSSFGDRRPTLFCIKTYLPDAVQAPWQNVNVTFDDFFDDEDIPRDERAWRTGLAFEDQATLMEQGLSPAQVVDL